MKYCKCKEKYNVALRLCAALVVVILFGCSQHKTQVADADNATQWWPAGYEYIPEEPTELAEGGLTETDLLDTDPDPSQAASRARARGESTKRRAYYSASRRQVTESIGDTFSSQVISPREKRSRALLMDTAQVALGTPYVYGGTSIRGFDCSGFVQWTYKNIGVRVPRTAQEQSCYGRSVGRGELRAGDIVAFRHPRRGYHTGIYVGNGKFIHSPRTNSHVQISSLDGAYYRSTYIGARRFPLPSSDDSRLDAASCLIQKHRSAKNPSRAERSRASAHSESTSHTRSYVASNARVRSDAAQSESSVRSERSSRHERGAVARSEKDKSRRHEEVASRGKKESQREEVASRSRGKATSKERVENSGGKNSKAVRREESVDRREKLNKREESSNRKKNVPEKRNEQPARKKEPAARADSKGKPSGASNSQQSAKHPSKQPEKSKAQNKPAPAIGAKKPSVQPGKEQVKKRR